MSQTKAQLLDGKSATIQFTGGSASVPSVSFTGDTNTGIYSPGADQVAISTGGSGRLFVDASGNVGVGASSPTRALDVNGSIQLPSNNALYINGSNNYLYADSTATELASATLIKFVANGSERLRITSAGLVGVGTSAPDANSQLHIVGSSYQPLYVNTTGVGGGGATFFRSGTQALYVGTAGSSWLSGSSTADGLVRAEANLVLATNGNSRAVTIDTSQRVGIGTSSPSSILHLATGTGVSSELRLSNPANNWSVKTGTSANSFSIVENQFGGTPLFINSLLQVGIGTTAPQNPLVVSNGGANGFEISSATNSGTTSYLLSYNRSTSAYTDLRFDASAFRFEVSASEKARIDSSGRFLVGTSGAWDASTDSVLQLVATGTSNPKILTFGRNSNSADAVLGNIEFYSASNVAARISGANDLAHGAGDGPGRLVFSTTADGASSPTERLRITSAGLVGVGTSSPQSAVDVLSGVRGVPETSGSTTSVTTLRLRGSSNGVLDIGELSSATAGSYWLQVRDKTDLGFAYNLALQPNGGNVGIGTTSPAKLLEVNEGDIQIRNSSTASINTLLNYGLTFRSTNQIGQDRGTIAEIKPYLGGQSDNDFGLQFRTQATTAGGVTTKMTLTPGGSLGIGTTSPNSVLQVNSGTNLGGILVGFNSGSSNFYDADLQVFRSGNGTERARIDSSGRLLVGTSSDSGGALLQVNGDRVRIATAKTPASATDTGTAGEICWDASYVYVCTATNTWKRSALSTW